MATSLGIIDGDLVGTQLPAVPALPALPAVPGIPTYPTTVPLPSTPDGNVVVPPTTPVAPPTTPVSPPPPQPSFWDNYGYAITACFAIFGAVCAIEMVRKGRI